MIFPFPPSISAFLLLIPLCSSLFHSRLFLYFRFVGFVRQNATAACRSVSSKPQVFWNQTPTHIPLLLVIYQTRSICMPGLLWWLIGPEVRTMCSLYCELYLVCCIYDRMKFWGSLQKNWVDATANKYSTFFDIAQFALNWDTGLQCNLPAQT